MSVSVCVAKLFQIAKSSYNFCLILVKFGTCGLCANVQKTVNRFSKNFDFIIFGSFFFKFYIWTYCHTAAVEQSRSRGLCSWGILLWYIYPWKRSKHKLYCWFRFMASCVLSVQWKCVKSSNALSLAFQMPPIEQLVSITVTHTEWNSICHIVTVEKFAVGERWWWSLLYVSLPLTCSLIMCSFNRKILNQLDVFVVLSTWKL